MYLQMVLLSFTSLANSNSGLALAYTILPLHASMMLLKPFLEYIPVDHCMEAVSIAFIRTFGHLLASL